MAQRELLVRIVGDNRSLRRAFAGSSRDADRFNASLVGTTRGLRRSALALTGFSGGLGAAFVTAVKSGAQFENTMQKIVGLSGVAQGAVNRLSKEILQLAPSVGKSPQELSEALYFITSSGIAAADAMAVLKVSAQAAAAGLGETQTVADAVTSAINAYGPSVVNAQKATDVLVATVREGKGEASEFAGVIGNVAAISAQLGVSFQDVGAALAAQTRLGTDAETAAIQLQQVFSSLVKTAPQSAKAFKSVGLSAAGLRKELAEEGLLATLETIRVAFGTNLPAMARAFGDIRALRGVLSLVGKQADATASIFERMANTTGSLSTAFGAVTEDTQQKFARMKAAIQVAAIQIGAALAPLAGEFAASLTKWLSDEDNVKDMAAAVRTLANAFKLMKDAIAPVIGLVGGLKNAVKILIALFVANKVLAWATAIRAVGVQSLFAAGGVSTLSARLATLKAIGPIAIAIGVSYLFAKGAEKLTGEKLFGGGLTGQNKSDFNIRNTSNPTRGSDGIWRAADGSPVQDQAYWEKKYKAGKITRLGRATVPASPDYKRQRGPDMRRELRESLDIKNRRRRSAEAERPGDVPERDRRKPLTATQRNTFFDNDIARALDRVQDSALRSQITKLQSISARLTERLAATKDVTRKLNLEDQLLDVRRRIKSIRTTIADDLKAAAEDARAALEDAGQALLDSLQFGLTKAQATTSTADDLAALDAINAGLRKRIRAEGETLDLQRQLFENRQQVLQVRRTQLDARQFGALGLSATGAEKIPGLTGLRRQLGSLSSAVEGTFLDTKKTESLMGRIRKVLSGWFGAVSEDVRATIRDMLADIRGQLDDFKGPLTKTTGLDTKSLVAGLGLNPEQVRELRGRVSGFNSAGRGLDVAPVGAGGGGFVGGRPIVVESHTTLQLDGHTVGKVVTRGQQKTRKRNPPQRRGPNAGMALG